MIKTFSETVKRFDNKKCLEKTETSETFLTIKNVLKSTDNKINRLSRQIVQLIQKSSLDKMKMKTKLKIFKYNSSFKYFNILQLI